MTDTPTSWTAYGDCDTCGALTTTPCYSLRKPSQDRPWPQHVANPHRGRPPLHPPTRQAA